MKLTIKTVSNGWVLKIKDEDEGQSLKVLYKEEDEREATLQNLKLLCYDIITHCGYDYDKWEKHNLVIDIKPGHKVSDSEEAEDGKN